MQNIHITNENNQAYVQAILNPQKHKHILSGAIYHTYCGQLQPLESCCIKILDEQYYPLEHTISNSSGNFSLLLPQNGSLVICAKDGFETQLFPLKQFPKTVTMQKDSSFNLVIGSIFVGRTPAKNPVMIRIYAPHYERVTMCNEKGEFIFENVPSGKYHISINGNFSNPYHNEFFVSPHAKIIPLGHIYLDYLPTLGTINGIITNHENIPLVGVTVVLYQNHKPIAYTKTIEDGIYFFGHIKAGNYHIQAFS